MTCPATAPKGCTLKIEISAAFLDLNTGNAVFVTVIVSDGSGLPGIDPDASITTCESCGEDTRTFQWMQRSVPAGTKATVTVQFAAQSGQALDRTEAIELFKN
jgi:hypothetical protein